MIVEVFDNVKANEFDLDSISDKRAVMFTLRESR